MTRLLEVVKITLPNDEQNEAIEDHDDNPGLTRQLEIVQITRPPGFVPQVFTDETSDSTSGSTSVTSSTTSVTSSTTSETSSTFESSSTTETETLATKISTTEEPVTSPTLEDAEPTPEGMNKYLHLDYACTETILALRQYWR